MERMREKRTIVKQCINETSVKKKSRSRHIVLYIEYNILPLLLSGKYMPKIGVLNPSCICLFIKIPYDMFTSVEMLILHE